MAPGCKKGNRTIKSLKTVLIKFMILHQYNVFHETCGGRRIPPEIRLLFGGTFSGRLRARAKLMMIELPLFFSPSPPGFRSNPIQKSSSRKGIRGRNTCFPSRDPSHACKKGIQQGEMETKRKCWEQRRGGTKLPLHPCFWD